MDKGIDQDVLAIAIGSAIVSVVDRLVEQIAEAMIDVFGEGVATFLHEKHPDMDHERYITMFKAAMDRSMEIAEMARLKEMLEEGGL